MALAKALSADALLLVTAATRIPTITPTSARALIGDGTIAGGMIPKVEEALSILD